MAPEGEPASPRVAKRPGCVTAYALLLGIWATLCGALVIVSVVFAVFVQDPATVPVELVFPLALVVVGFLIARGLWRLRNWARIAVIVLHSLWIVLFLLRLVTLPEGLDPAFALGAVLVGVGISGCIIYWLASHGEHFE